MIHSMDLFMSLLKKHWRFTLPITVVVLCLIVSALTLYGTDKPQEPKTVYTVPEQSSNEPPAINTGGASLQTPTNARAETKTEGAEIAAMETSSGADTTDDLEPLEECCDDEELLDTSTKRKLSIEEIEERVKIVNDFFDEVDREFKTNEADRDALFARSDELEENYFAYIYAIAELLSPEYQQRLGEIESHDELTQAERDAINDELHIIGKELGIDDMGEYMQSAAKAFIDKFLALRAAADKLDERDMQLIKEMEEFSP